MPIAMTRYLPKGSVFFGTTVEFFDMFWKVLSGNQIKILGALARNQSMDTGHPARLSISRIAKMCGMTRRTTGLGMEGLVSMGLVLPKDGAYYLQILTLDQASDALKRTDVIRNCSPDLIEKCSHSRSKTAQFGTKTRAETAHILREEEEEKVEERGQELVLGGPGLPVEQLHRPEVLLPGSIQAPGQLGPQGDPGPHDRPMLQGGALDYHQHHDRGGEAARSPSGAPAEQPGTRGHGGRGGQRDDA